MVLLTWLMTNWLDIVQIYAGIVGVASIIIKLTPTVKDDNILKGFLKFTGKIIALNRK